MRIEIGARRLLAFFITTTGSLCLLFACGSPPPPPNTALITECAPKIVDSCPGNDALCLRRAAIALQKGPLRNRDYRKAAECLECSCKSDDTEACRRLGELYMQGEGVAEDGDRALQLFEGACEVGDGDACAWVGLFLVKEGNLTAKAAMRFIRKGCNMGGPMACSRLGSAYARGKYVARKDLPKATRLLSSSCRQGEAYGCRMMGALSRKELKDEGRAIEWYQQACDLEAPLGCWELGLSLTTRAVSERDPNQGANAFDEGCLYGSGDSCNALGEMKRDGRGRDRDLEAAAHLFKEACRGRSARGCYNWGLVLSTGARAKAAPEQAFEAMHSACEAKEKEACAWLGTRYVSGQDTKKDPTKGLLYFEQACSLNHWQGCLNLHYLAAQGILWEGSREDAPRRMRAACEENDANACYQLALLLREEKFKNSDGNKAPSTGQPTPEKQAALQNRTLPLFEKACAGRIENACLETALILSNPGRGLEPNYEHAAGLFQPLCDAGNPIACNELGSLYANGRGVEQDRERAFSLFQGACKQDLALACRRLAKGYEKGWGTKRDRALAQEHYEKACSLGCSECCAPTSR